MRRRRFRRRITGKKALLLILTAILLLPVWLLLRCRPVVTEFASSGALWMAEQTANEAAAEVLQDDAEQCRRLVTATYNDRRILSGVSVDTASVNAIKTEVVAAVMKKMQEASTVQVPIPLGTLLGLDWFSGWGPLIELPIGVVSSVMSSVSSELEATGMNQSTYRLLIHIEIGMLCVTPGGRTSVSATVSFPMAELVLLGEVPDALTEVYGDDQDTAGRIFDYGAESTE